MSNLQLILVRGLPGSGKSTLARTYCAYRCWQHLETDQFWGPDYNFDFARLGEAHQWCKDETRKFLNVGVSVAVSNTFTTKKELQPYFDIAAEFGITPQVILCQGKWGNVHNVPEEVLVKMKNRFEYDISDMGVSNAT